MRKASKVTTAAGAAIILSVALGGCLSSEVTNSGLVATPPVPGGNSAPTISGNPQAAVMLGSIYSFIPSANDPDGDTLTFSVQNQPSWASFNIATGELSGSPSLADVGVFDQIVISVTDGTETASIPSYAITVSQTQLGSMSLSWTPPTANTDGSALTNLAGYRIYYGSSQGVYPNRVDVDTAGISTYVVENLIPDTYYVVATSINAAGIESAYSNVAVKTVQ